uniref:Uncharacterized protein n=1 Tax=Romanomermis culicivorax TaxID=13658 RepID=A0A915JYQ6_ROMCU
MVICLTFQNYDQYFVYCSHVCCYNFYYFLNSCFRDESLLLLLEMII